MRRYAGRFGLFGARAEWVRVRRESRDPSIRALFDTAFYLDAYPDVRNAGVDPLIHFLQRGASEWRRPNALFYPQWYGRKYLDRAEPRDPFRHYHQVGQHRGLRFNPIDDPSFIAAEYGLQVDVSPILFLRTHDDIDRVAGWFSRNEYLASNPDVEAAGILPEAHFLDFGLRERRRCGTRCTVTVLPEAGSSNSDDQAELVMDSFDWSDRTYRVTSCSIPDRVVTQLRAQSEIEPDVAAVGRDQLSSLRAVRAGDLDTRISAEYRRLLSDVPIGQDAVVLLSEPDGDVGDFGVDLASGLVNLGMDSVLVATTGDSRYADELAARREFANAKPRVRFAALGDSMGQSAIHEMVLAHLLLRAAPRHLFVVSGDLGWRTVATYGRALSSQMRTTVICRRQWTDTTETPGCSSYLEAVLSYAHVLVDDLGMLDKLAGDASTGIGGRFGYLPAPVGMSDPDAFQRPLASPPARGDGQLRVLWTSRWDTSRSVDILVRLAEHAPGLLIDAYDMPGSRRTDERVPNNLQRKGALPRLSNARLDDYDAFLFTGGPARAFDAVLEAAVAGVPIVALDFTGLRETFSEDAIDVVPTEISIDEAADAFKSIISQLSIASPEARRARLTRARNQVEGRHGTSAYMAGLARYLDGSR